MRSVDRAVSLLQLLGQRGQGRVGELARDLDIHKSTVSRLLATLERRGLVEQNPDGTHYRLGPGAAQLADGANRAFDLRLLARPVCERLADDVGETVNLAVHDAPDVISIDQVMASSAVVITNWVGQRTPLHATAAGKLFLAYFPVEVRDSVLAGSLARFTERTIVDRRDLLAELDEVRDRGYAVAIEEHEVGLNVVGAPIFRHDGTVVAALTVSGPSFRVDRSAMPALAEATARAAGTISRKNGYHALD